MNLLQELANLHNLLSGKLKEASMPKAKLKVHEVFLEFREKFLIYVKYVANLNNAVDMLLSENYQELADVRNNIHCNYNVKFMLMFWF